MYVLHLLLRTLQSNPGERKPAHFPLGYSPLNAGPSFRYVSQTKDGVVVDGEAEFELSDHLVANATGYALSFLWCICRRGWSMVASRLGYRLVLM